MLGPQGAPDASPALPDLFEWRSLVRAPTPHSLLICSTRHRAAAEDLALCCLLAEEQESPRLEFGTSDVRESQTSMFLGGLQEPCVFASRLACTMNPNWHSI